MFSSLFIIYSYTVTALSGTFYEEKALDKVLYFTTLSNVAYKSANIKHHDQDEEMKISVAGRGGSAIRHHSAIDEVCRAI